MNPATGLHVLLVDDDVVVLRVLEQMLRMCQYTVTSCQSGQSAVALLRGQPAAFDLVLSDVYMPDIDGFKLLEVRLVVPAGVASHLTWAGIWFQMGTWFCFLDYCS